MKFKVDENLPEELTQLLRDGGWDSTSVDEQRLGGAKDAQLVQVCAAEQRIPVTFDRGFANLKLYGRAGLPGIVVFRLKRQDKPHVLEMSGRFIEELRRREIRGELWIVHENRIRIRILER